MAAFILILTLTLAVAVNAAAVWLLPAGPWKPWVQFIVGVAGFVLGMVQGVYQKYLADLLTDRRREAEAQKKRTAELADLLPKVEPVVANFRQKLSTCPDTLIRRFNYCAGDFQFGGPPFIKILDPNTGQHHSMLLRLENHGLLTIDSKPSLSHVGGIITEELYHILRDQIESQD